MYLQTILIIIIISFGTFPNSLRQNFDQNPHKEVCLLFVGPSALWVKRNSHIAVCPCLATLGTRT
jgi:hypothetical protein